MNPFQNAPVFSRSSVVDVLTCPHCWQVQSVKREDVDVLRGQPKCFIRRCGKSWWAMELHSGPVQVQLAAVFGDEIAGLLMQTYHNTLPAKLERPMFWQLLLSKPEGHEVNQAGILSFVRRIHLRLLPGT